MVNQVSLPICETCGFVFVPSTTWQRYCDADCRTGRSVAPDRHCLGCGTVLTGKQKQWCGRSCRSRRYLVDSVLLRCQSEACPRQNILMVQRFRRSAAAYECAACGQLTAMAAVGDAPPARS